MWKFLETGGKRAISVWHRRAGKDEVTLHWTAVAAHQRPASYWHMLPEFGQGRKAIWDAVNPHTGRRRIDEAFPHELRESTRENEMFIRFRTGSSWQIVGSDRYDAAVGSPPAGIVFSEWALSNPASWAHLAPILVENNGWAAFITTPRGRNHALSMLNMARDNPSWFAEVLTVTDTGALSREAIEAQRVEYVGLYGEDAGEALLQQEYFCSFNSAILGAYWAKELNHAEQEGRICDVPVDHDHPVHVSWDLGMSDSMALWCFQVSPGKLHIVDFYQASGHGFEHYTDWLNERGYNGTDYVPHDAKVRELGTGRSRIETLIQLKRKPRLVPNLKLMDGINSARLVIPRARFDKTRCAAGIEALREYKCEWDQEARVFKKTPAHDWASHPADSWRYLSLAYRDMAPEPTPEEVKAKEEAERARYAGTMTVDDLIRLHGLHVQGDRMRV